MGGTKTTNNTSGTTTSTIPQEILNRGTAITNDAMASYANPNSPASSYTSANPTYAQDQQIGANTTGQLNQYNQTGGTAAQQYNNAATGYQGAFQSANNGLSQANQNNQAQTGSVPAYSQSAIDQYMNPYTNDVVNSSINIMNQQLAKQQATTNDQAGMSGAFGGDRQAVENANNNYNNNLAMGSMVSNALNTGYTNAQGQFNTNVNQTQNQQTLNNAASAQNFAQQNAVSQLQANLAQQDSANQLAAGNANLNLGNTITAQDQAQKTNAYNNGYMGPMNIDSQLAAMNAMQPVNRTSTTTGTSTGTQSGGWLGPALGAAGSVLSSAAPLMLASDERAKENIKDVDPEKVLGAFAKVPAKSYEYKPEVRGAFSQIAPAGRRTGPMAQDLEKAFGESSGPEIGGMKTVDMAQMMGRLTAAVTGLEKRTRSLARSGKRAA